MSDRRQRRPANGTDAVEPTERPSEPAATEAEPVSGTDHGHAAVPDDNDRTSERPNAPPALEQAPRRFRETWNIPDGAADELADQARPLPALVSFHYLRAAVRRRWRICALSALLGMLLALAFLAVNPAPHTATTTLRLVHGEQGDPSGAIATDITLVKTRIVAERTIAALRLSMRPETLMNSVTAVPTGSTEILQLTMSGPSDVVVLHRLNTFADQYLRFRATEISAQSQILIDGYNAEIDQLQSQAQTLREQVARLANGVRTADQLTEAVTKLSQINEKISTLQGTVDDETLRQRAIVSASRVIDPAAPTSASALRRIILVIASGLIGGLAIGFGVIVLWAILSDRLWLRLEVAAALNAPVLTSVPRIAPLPRLCLPVRWLPWIRAKESRRAVERQRVARVIEHALPRSGRRQCLAVLSLSNSDEMRFGVVTAGAQLQKQGRTVTIVDLTDAGKVASAVARCPGGTPEERPAVFRPSSGPPIPDNPAVVDIAAWDDVPQGHIRNRVTLVLADLDPAIGVDDLAAWTDTVVVAVTAGKSGVELVRTAGDLVRSVGMLLRGAVILRVVRNDTSSGLSTVCELEDAEPGVPRTEVGIERFS